MTDEERQKLEERYEEINAQIGTRLEELQNVADKIRETINDLAELERQWDYDDLNECLKLGLLPGVKILWKPTNTKYIMLGYNHTFATLKEDGSEKTVTGEPKHLLKGKEHWEIIKD